MEGRTGKVGKGDQRDYRRIGGRTTLMYRPDVGQIKTGSRMFPHLFARGTFIGRQVKSGHDLSKVRVSRRST